jgi:hypothetical protein
MGVRLYNPATGRFLTVDPVVGGNPNAYTYPVDPVNMYDLDGRWGFKKFMRRVGWGTGMLSTGLGAMSFCQWCQAGSLALAGVSAGAWALGGNYSQARSVLLAGAVGAFTGGAGRWGGRFGITRYYNRSSFGGWQGTTRLYGQHMSDWGYRRTAWFGSRLSYAGGLTASLYGAFRGGWGPGR